MGSFHSRFLKGKALAIACPKLDQGTETYIEKLTVMIDTAKVNTVTVMMMEVPCCGGLMQMVVQLLPGQPGRYPSKLSLSVSTERYCRRIGYNNRTKHNTNQKTSRNEYVLLPVPGNGKRNRMRRKGVCGKTDDVAQMQDILVWVAKGISILGTIARRITIQMQRLTALCRRLSSQQSQTPTLTMKIIEKIHEGIALRDKFAGEMKAKGIAIPGRPS
jgi:hypothetical protein